ncbi:MAG: hypothetical protein ACON35_05460 [Candidatus Marinamargulisbacteria bacterium]
MLITTLNNRVNKTIQLSESLNLTNHEEQQLTMQLVKDLKKLLKIIITKSEKDRFKNKLKMIKSDETLKQLRRHLMSAKTSQYFPFLSLSSNLRLQLSPKSKATKESIFNELDKTIGNATKQLNQDNDLLIIEDEESLSDETTFFEKVSKECSNQKCPNISLKASLFINKNELNRTPFVDFNGKLIIDISTSSEFRFALEIIKKRAQLNAPKITGLSLNILERNSLKYIDHLCNTLSETEKRFCLIRIKKGHHVYAGSKTIKQNQLIKINTFYKWAVFTTFNLIRKHRIKVIINCNNLFDIAWLLIQRAQLNIESQIKFEVNITKFPNISKIIYLFSNENTKSKSIIINDNINIKLKIVLKKLIQQAVIYRWYKSSELCTKTLFIKSHKRFFIYLKHNFLKTYLHKITIDE